jgi:hypothetical protein
MTEATSLSPSPTLVQDPHLGRENQLIEDPIDWSLVAFTLLEGGKRTEGFAALNVAIEQETRFDASMRRSASQVVSEGQANG